MVFPKVIMITKFVAKRSCISGYSHEDQLRGTQDVYLLSVIGFC
jgi:hypothetical protein